MSNKPSITAIVLTYNEELHIERCITSLLPIVQKIIVVDSFSSDRTCEIARRLGAETICHEFQTQAQQFQWALDSLEINTDWILRIDADEYVQNDLVEEIKYKLPTLSDDVIGIYLKRKVYFYGKWIRRGGVYPLLLLRLWRTGHGKIEDRWMDEHTVLPPGSQTDTFMGGLVDENVKGISAWLKKIDNYSTREMVELLNGKYYLFNVNDTVESFDDPQAKKKRVVKNSIYAKMPLFLRSLAYFIYRYFFLLGFLDGSRGFLFHMLQGFVYRLIVDVKLMEVRGKCGGDRKKILSTLRKDYGIEFGQKRRDGF